MITIPKGKQVSIKLNGSDVLEQIGYTDPMTLDTEVTFTLRSDFESLLGQGNASQRALTVISGVTQEMFGGGISGRFKEMGFQIWNGTEPIKFSFTTTFNMRANAKRDVFEPAIELMKIVLPVETKTGLAAPGPSILDAFNNNWAKYPRRYSFRCGIFYLPKVIVEKVEPTWASEYDDQGYPIWCTLSIDVSSIYTATQTQIEYFGLNDNSTAEGNT